MATTTVVLAEDERAIRELLVHHLRRERFDVVEAADGQLALRAARSIADVLVLDVGLPVLDGFEVVRMLRKERRLVPIIMLTARTDEIDRIIGFEAGVDDYVCKPFSPHEMVARIRAVLRRVDPRKLEAQPTALHLGRLIIDEVAREARIDGQDMNLRPLEFKLLFELASNCGVAFSRERLVDRVWGLDYEGNLRTVDVHISRLRALLEEDCGLPPMIVTVPGFGYKFIRPDHAS